jgi:hypothetical protein
MERESIEYKSEDFSCVIIVQFSISGQTGAGSHHSPLSKYSHASRTFGWFIEVWLYPGLEIFPDSGIHTENFHSSGTQPDTAQAVRRDRRYRQTK